MEALIAELDYKRINIEVVNRLLENATYDMNQLEELAYLIVQNATLTEQLLQYSNRYRSFDESVQKAFNRSLSILKRILITKQHLKKFHLLWKQLNLV